MIHTIANAGIALWLIASLVVCPYTCAHFPRTREAEEATADCCCHDACCGGDVALEEGSRPDQSVPAPEKPCSCPCVCKGALAECSARQHVGDLDPAGAMISLPLATADPALVIDTTGLQPDPPPPKLLSGREIRALISSLQI